LIGIAGLSGCDSSECSGSSYSRCSKHGRRFTFVGIIGGILFVEEISILEIENLEAFFAVTKGCECVCGWGDLSLVLHRR